MLSVQCQAPWRDRSGLDCPGVRVEVGVLVTPRRHPVLSYCDL